MPYTQTATSFRCKTGEFNALTEFAHPTRFRNALLQPDGSVLVSLAGDDADAMPSGNRPGPTRSSAFFCRLLPGTFDRDPAFGGGFVARRLPGEDQVISTQPALRFVDYQIPAGLQPLGTNTVVGAVSCQTGRHPLFPGFFNQSPDLLADGSVGMVRLV